MQKKSNPYSWIYLIITLVLALIMVYLMLPYLQESDLNERPHNAQVWGSVSDWAMVLVTGVTAWFIWRTLSEQMIVSKIEANKHRYSILPKFIVSQSDTNNSEVSVKLNIVVKGWDAWHVKLVDGDDEKTLLSCPTGLEVIEAGDYFSITFNSIHLSLQPASPQVLCKFKFKDIEGNPYECSVIHVNNKYSNLTPQLIKKY